MTGRQGWSLPDGFEAGAEESISYDGAPASGQADRPTSDAQHSSDATYSPTSQHSPASQHTLAAQHAPAGWPQAPGSGQATWQGGDEPSTQSGRPTSPSAAQPGGQASWQPAAAASSQPSGAKRGLLPLILAAAVVVLGPITSAITTFVVIRFGLYANVGQTPYLLLQLLWLIVSIVALILGIRAMLAMPDRPLVPALAIGAAGLELRSGISGSIAVLIGLIFH